MEFRSATDNTHMNNNLKLRASSKLIAWKRNQMHSSFPLIKVTGPPFRAYTWATNEPHRPRLDCRNWLAQTEPRCCTALINPWRCVWCVRIQLRQYSNLRPHLNQGNKKLLRCAEITCRSICGFLRRAHASKSRPFSTEGLKIVQQFRLRFLRTWRRKQGDRK